MVVSSDYLDKLDEDGISPSPATETTDGERTIWRFAPPPTDVLTVSVGAQIESGVHQASRGRVEVFAGQARSPAARLDFSTLVMP